MSLWYRTIRLLVTAVLRAYFRKIEVNGEEHVPPHGAVLFTANHQNAFLDALLIATTNKRVTHFLVRADVFRTSSARKFFQSLNMMPVYRWRDGRHGLTNNQEIFRKCHDILTNGHTLLVFPEANHHQQRRLLPLSKGFTRITWGVEDIKVVPVGLNYSHHRLMGGSVLVNYGSPIEPASALELDQRQYAADLVEKTTLSMQRLITHIAPTAQYQLLEEQLNRDPWQYLDPQKCNHQISLIHHQPQDKVPAAPKSINAWRQLAVGVSNVLNFLPLMISSLLLKKIGDPVFSSSIKVMTGLVLFPLYYLLLAVVAINLLSPAWGIALVLLAIFSMMLRKWSLSLTTKQKRKS